MTLTPEQLDNVAYDLLGTCADVWKVLQDPDMSSEDAEEIEEQLSDYIERCQLCDWWFEVGERDSEPEPGYCEDCRQ